MPHPFVTSVANQALNQHLLGKYMANARDFSPIKYAACDISASEFWLSMCKVLSSTPSIAKEKKIKIERIERKNGYWSHIFSKPNYKEKYMYIFSHCHESECEEVQFAYSCFTVCNLWWTKEVVVIALLLTYLHNKKTKSTSIK